jgi:hypothetical protein
MGCDIHAYLEYQPWGGDSWWTFAALHLLRDYSLFAAINGVRNYEGAEGVVEHRGVPKDCSWQVKQEYTLQVDDWHSATWLDREEVREVCERVPHNREIRAVLGMMRALEQTGPTRLVLWYDN